MTTNQDRAAEIIGQHVKCGWSICDRRRHEDGTRPPLDVCENTSPSCRDVAEYILDDLDGAGFLNLDYLELAPENRFGIGRGTEHVIISDNQARTTIRIPAEHAAEFGRMIQAAAADYASTTKEKS